MVSHSADSRSLADITNLLQAVICFVRPYLPGRSLVAERIIQSLAIVFGRLG